MLVLCAVFFLLSVNYYSSFWSSSNHVGTSAAAGGGDDGLLECKNKRSGMACRRIHEAQLGAAATTPDTSTRCR